ncbi:MAG: ATP-binding cassette domain-containing protein [Chloroflexota bacterium]|nr:ATP-binding cassette domain-containing protein [Chloroflexota bacterium]
MTSNNMSVVHEVAGSQRARQAENRPSIQVESLVFGYQGRPPVFEGFSWQVQSGDSWAVLGPSGCGKSTLLYLLAGLRQPSAGSLLVDGYPVPRPRASTGLILQEYGLLPWYTVRDNVALGQQLGHFYRGKHPEGDLPRPYPPSDILPERVDYWLDRLGIAAVQSQYPGQISGGQRQRAAIARTLLLEPTLLLMDEPFSSLDAMTREDLEDLTLTLQAETGLTTVVVTHNIEEAAYLGRQILVLGQPPQRQLSPIENLTAGHLDYRRQPEFQRMCGQLRDTLDDVNASVGALS